MEEFIKKHKPEEISFNSSKEDIENLLKQDIVEEEKNKNISNDFFNNYQKPNIEKKY